MLLRVTPGHTWSRLVTQPTLSFEMRAWSADVVQRALAVPHPHSMSTETNSSALPNLFPRGVPVFAP